MHPNGLQIKASKYIINYLGLRQYVFLGGYMLTSIKCNPLTLTGTFLHKHEDPHSTHLNWHFSAPGLLFNHLWLLLYLPKKTAAVYFVKIDEKIYSLEGNPTYPSI